MNAITPVLETHTFRDKDFVGGDVVLDFVNTVTGRNGRPRDWIPSFGALADWAAAARLLPKNQCESLKRRSRHDSEDARAALMTARKLREVLYRVLMRSIDGGSGGKEDLQCLHQMWCHALGRHSLRSVRGSVQPALLRSSTDPEAIGSVLAVRAMDVLRDLPVTRLRQCAGPNCAWLFIDSSKGGRRRWCDMATCGNDAKARRHYLSRKKSTAGERRSM
jgi:predicted RNA-binding Zn ribbon-like protein